MAVAGADGRTAGLKVVDVIPTLPVLRGQWAMAGQVGFVADLGERLPGARRRAVGRDASGYRGGPGAVHAGKGGVHRVLSTPTQRSHGRPLRPGRLRHAPVPNPDVAFAAEGPPPSSIPGADLIHEIGFARAIMNTAALTAPSNLNGSPAVSIPCGLVDDLPVGLQVLSGHHREQLLLDLAVVAEREVGWPKVAPGSPHRI